MNQWESDARQVAASLVDLVETTLEALTRGQVTLLVVHDDPADDRRASCSLDPFAGALQPGTIAELGRHVEARLVDVAIAGALTSGAAVRVVPAAARLDEGMGALLRFAVDEAPAAATG